MKIEGYNEKNILIGGFEVTIYEVGFKVIESEYNSSAEIKSYA